MFCIRKQSVLWYFKDIRVSPSSWVIQLPLGTFRCTASVEGFSEIVSTLT